MAIRGTDVIEKNRFVSICPKREPYYAQVSLQQKAPPQDLGKIGLWLWISTSAGVDI
jgi:hypothetical protein